MLNMIKKIYEGNFKRVILVLMIICTSGIFNIFIPLVTKYLMDEGFIGKNLKSILFGTGILGGINLANCLLNFNKEKIRVKIKSNILYKLNVNMFKELLYKNISFYKENNISNIINTVSQDINNIARLADSALFQIISQIFSIIGAMVGVFIINKKILIFIIIILPIQYVLIKMFSSKKQVLMKAYLEGNKNNADWMGDSLYSIKEIKLFNLYNKKINEFNIIQEDVIYKTEKLAIIDAIKLLIDTIIPNIVSIGIYVYGGYLLVNDKISLGSVVAISTYSLSIITPVSLILSIKYYLSGIIPSYNRYNEMLEKNREDKFKKQYIHSNRFEKTVDLEIKNLVGGYNNKNILQDINLEIKKGDKIAIIGKNGSGKSTLIDLILQFKNPIQGEILLNGKNIANYDRDSYRQLFSVVTQDTRLFNKNIKYNICLDKAVEDNEYIEILKMCLIEKFNDLETAIGVNGEKLSGGERQKISLARALIYNRLIMIFDEPTSNIDADSKKIIHNIFKKIGEDKIIILITHDKELLQYMNRVFLLEKGSLREVSMEFKKL